jgi:hypothetical protein
MNNNTGLKVSEDASNPGARKIATGKYKGKAFRYVFEIDIRYIDWVISESYKTWSPQVSFNAA